MVTPYGLQGQNPEPTKAASRPGWVFENHGPKCPVASDVTESSAECQAGLPRPPFPLRLGPPWAFSLLRLQSWPPQSLRLPAHPSSVCPPGPSLPQSPGCSQGRVIQRPALMVPLPARARTALRRPLSGVGICQPRQSRGAGWRGSEVRSTAARRQTRISPAPHSLLRGLGSVFCRRPEARLFSPAQGTWRRLPASLCQRVVRVISLLARPKTGPGAPQSSVGLAQRDGP